MCLLARLDHPLEGMHPIKFDAKGYITCFKIYTVFKNKLQPPYQGGGGVENGWIISDRKGKELSEENGDYEDARYNLFCVSHGIHVSLTREETEREVGNNQVVVTVRCHKRDFVASCSRYPDAVFMKVFLKKADYKKALK